MLKPYKNFIFTSIIVILLISGFLLFQHIENLNLNKPTKNDYSTDVSAISSHSKNKPLPKRDSTVLRVCPNTSQPKTLDPAPFVNKQILHLLFDSLVKLDKEGNVVNNLTSSIQRVNNNSLDIVF